MYNETRLSERASIRVCFEEGTCARRCACVCTGELKVNDVKRAPENPEAKRENAVFFLGLCPDEGNNRLRLRR